MEIRRFTQTEAMMTEAAAVLARVLAQPGSTPFAVMLSGGETPMPVYRRLAASRPTVSPYAHVFFSDERMVPFSSRDSNYGRIHPFLTAIRLPDERIITVSTERDLDSAANDYDKTLRTFLERGGFLPLGFLGVGSDGHTASLFTMEDLERGRSRYAIAVRRPTKPDRVSVTPLLMSRIQRIIFLATGPDKAAVLQRMIQDSPSVVAARAVEACRSVEIWTAD